VDNGQLRWFPGTDAIKRVPIVVECLVTDHWVILAIPHHVFCTICIHNLRWMDRMAIDSLYMYTNIPHVMHINNNTSSIASLQIHVHVHNVTLRMPVVAN
jgi:hypothetical protein